MGKLRGKLLAVTAALLVIVLAPLGYQLWHTVSQLQQTRATAVNARCFASVTPVAQLVAIAVGYEAIFTHSQAATEACTIYLTVPSNERDLLSLSTGLAPGNSSAVGAACQRLLADRTNPQLVRDVSWLMFNATRLAVDSSLAQLARVTAEECGAPGDPLLQAVGAAIAGQRLVATRPATTANVTAAGALVKVVNRRLQSLVTSKVAGPTGTAFSISAMMDFIARVTIIRAGAQMYVTNGQVVDGPSYALLEDCFRSMAYMMDVVRTMPQWDQRLAPPPFFTRLRAALDASYAQQVPLQSFVNLTSVNVWGNVTSYAATVYHVTTFIQQGVLQNADEQATAALHALASTVAVVTTIGCAIIGSLITLNWAKSRQQFFEAQQTVVQRQELIRHIMHEARVPLNSVSIGLDLLHTDGDQMSSQERGDLVGVMQQAASTMASVLSAVLDLQKLDASSLKLSIVPTFIIDDVQAVLSIMRAGAADRGVTITLECSQRLLDRRRVMCDPLRIRQIASNLISNSTKFSPPGSRIVVDVRLDEFPLAAPASALQAGMQKRLLNTRPSPNESTARLHELSSCCRDDLNSGDGTQEGGAGTRATGCAGACTRAFNSLRPRPPTAMESLAHLNDALRASIEASIRCRSPSAAALARAAAQHQRTHGKSPTAAVATASAVTVGVDSTSTTSSSSASAAATAAAVRTLLMPHVCPALLTISVTDSGPGMNADELSRLFTPFYQASSNRSATTGTGLGLTIARHLVRLHGGELHLSSQPGQGTTATFSFPTLSLDATVLADGSVPSSPATTAASNAAARLSASGCGGSTTATSAHNSPVHALHAAVGCTSDSRIEYTAGDSADQSLTVRGAAAPALTRDGAVSPPVLDISSTPLPAHDAPAAAAATVITPTSSLYGDPVASTSARKLSPSSVAPAPPSPPATGTAAIGLPPGAVSPHNRPTAIAIFVDTSANGSAAASSVASPADTRHDGSHAFVQRLLQRSLASQDGTPGGAPVVPRSCSNMSLGAASAPAPTSLSGGSAGVTTVVRVVSPLSAAPAPSRTATAGAASFSGAGAASGGGSTLVMPGIPTTGVPLSPSAAPPLSPPTSAQPGPLTGVSCLVVDDDAANRMLLSRLARRLGAQTTLAPSGADALDALAAHPEIRVVFLDRNMGPGLDGLQTASKMRKRGYTGLIIGVTGDVLTADQEAFRLAGLDGLLCKPITSKDITSMLASLGCTSDDPGSV